MLEATDSLQTFRALRISSATVADVLDAMGVDGALDGRIHAQNKRHFHAVGYAYTVQWAPVRKLRDIKGPQPSTWEQVKNFLVPQLSTGRDLVYVAGAGPLLCDAALAGGMSSTYFQQLGFEAVVLGGAVRDLSELERLDMPVLATNPIPTDTQGAYKVAEVGGSCIVDNRLIRSGDLIVADENGVVAVPGELVGETLERAMAIERLEAEMLDRIRQGERLPELIERSGRI